MEDTIQIGDLIVLVTRKDVKNVHLSVHPPKGSIRVVAPFGARLEIVRAYVVSKLGWIYKQQEKFVAQLREMPRLFVERESHYLWGRRYLLSIVESEDKPFIRLSHRKITFGLPSGADLKKREAMMYAWHKNLLKKFISPLIDKWETKLGVKVTGYYLQRMKTKWGSCNHRAGHIRLNTELVKKPKDLVEYVIVHEMMHLLEPTHNHRFVDLMNRYYPSWREARNELNALPL